MKKSSFLELGKALEKAEKLVARLEDLADRELLPESLVEKAYRVSGALSTIVDDALIDEDAPPEQRHGADERRQELKAAKGLLATRIFQIERELKSGSGKRAVCRGSKCESDGKQYLYTVDGVEACRRCWQQVLEELR